MFYKRYRKFYLASSVLKMMSILMKGTFSLNPGILTCNFKMVHNIVRAKIRDKFLKIIKKKFFFN